jgi:hypothetical protein
MAGDGRREEAGRLTLYWIAIGLLVAVGVLSLLAILSFFIRR